MALEFLGMPHSLAHRSNLLIGPVAQAVSLTYQVIQFFGDTTMGTGMLILHAGYIISLSESMSALI